MSYQLVAFLRGINVGGNKKVPMEELKKVLEQEGFTNVQTLLNSGNIVFESSESLVENIRESIEKTIEKTFGFHSDVIVRLGQDIQKVISQDPFQSVAQTPQTRLYVTFRSENQKISDDGFPIPEKDIQVLHVSLGEIYWVVIISQAKGTTEGMKYIEKKYGKNSTTRSWETIQKIARLLRKTA